MSENTAGDRMLSRRRLASLGIGGLVATAVPGLLVEEARGQGNARRKPYVAPKTQPKHDMSDYGIPEGPPQKMAFLIYPEMTALDFVGPFQILSSLMNVETHLVWKKRETVKSDAGIPITATTSFADCPDDLTLLFAPGGSRGTIALLDDAETLSFMAKRGAKAKYVTSVCTGSLILGAAGLLKGYRATSHWGFYDLLAGYGATPVAERVVTDRNRVTGAGVTAGLDFALQLTEKLRNTKYAKALQLVFEYDPQPPYNAGFPTNPDAAGVLEMAEATNFPMREAIKGKIAKAQPSR